MSGVYKGIFLTPVFVHSPFFSLITGKRGVSCRGECGPGETGNSAAQVEVIEEVRCRWEDTGRRDEGIEKGRGEVGWET